MKQNVAIPFNSSQSFWIQKTNKFFRECGSFGANCQTSGQTHYYKHCQPVLHLQVKKRVISVNLECARRKKQDKEDASVVGEERVAGSEQISKLESTNYKTVPLGWRV